MPKTDGSTTTGGVLLGTDASTYRFFIEQAHCLVAEKEGQIVGFGIILPDHLLRTSDIWRKRAQATWQVNLEKYEPQRLCYFEQLAFLPGNKRLVLILAYNLVKWAFDLGCETLFATTVNQPVLNLAAIPFIRAVHGIKAGNIDEEYPLIGPINSDIFLLSSENFHQYSRTHKLFPFVSQHSVSWR